MSPLSPLSDVPLNASSNPTGSCDRAKSSSDIHDGFPPFLPLDFFLGILKPACGLYQVSSDIKTRYCAHCSPPVRPTVLRQNPGHPHISHRAQLTLRPTPCICSHVWRNAVHAVLHAVLQHLCRVSLWHLYTCSHMAAPQPSRRKAVLKRTSPAQMFCNLEPSKSKSLCRRCNWENHNCKPVHITSHLVSKRGMLSLMVQKRRR